MEEDGSAEDFWETGFPLCEGGRKRIADSNRYTLKLSSLHGEINSERK